MAEFRRQYYVPMDRAYNQYITQAPPPNSLEKPIVPGEFNVQQLGETVPENDPQGRNILQTTQAAIRGGAGTLQIVMTTPHTSPIGGRFKSLGKEVRQALKEVIMANNVQMPGVELPTSLRNLSGYDMQRNAFSEEARREGLEEVKDAIKFTADVMGGGGIDIVSMEFPRAINDAKWNTDKKNKFDRTSTDEQFAQMVDSKEGRIRNISKVQPVYLPFDTKSFKELTPEPGQPITRDQVQKFEWQHFTEWAKKNKEYNEQHGLKQGMSGYNPGDQKYNEEHKLKENDAGWQPETPEHVAAAKQSEVQIKQTLAAAARDRDAAENTARVHEQIKKQLEAKDLEAAEREKLTKALTESRERYKQFAESYYANTQGAEDLRNFINNLKPVSEYGLQKSAQTYAEAGVIAMRQSEITKQRDPTVKTIHVGPEIGWPDYYGSHPTEFVELIDKSRQKMIDLLTKPKLDGQENIYFDPKLSEGDAKKRAQEHIKGLFDTSHMGMWLAHFKAEKDPKTGTLETEEVRLTRFNKWFKDQTKFIAEESKKRGLVGGIQLVDSGSAAHGHLPPGQGIFPVMEAAKIFKDAGYEGFFVSEGHEEEKFGSGRIRTKTWQGAGATLGNGYFGGAPMQWGQVQNGYFGKSYSPLFMFGGYSPSNDFKLWSEVPLE